MVGRSISRGGGHTKDVDVAVLRPEHEALLENLAGWDLRIAYQAQLRVWSGGPVGPPENAVWGRPGGAIEWHLDFKVEAVEGDRSRREHRAGTLPVGRRPQPSSDATLPSQLRHALECGVRHQDVTALVGACVWRKTRV